MLFNFLTIFPELIQQSLSFGILAQAIKNEHIKIQTLNLRDFASDKHRSVDDKPFGGSDGMLMKPEVLGKCLDSVSHTKILFPSPQGKLFNQTMAKQWAEQHSEISFLCGRYAGIDERVLVHYQIEEVSLGDYVVSGGEWPALIIMDAIARHRPLVLGNQISVSKDSFSQGILESPSFTRPQVWNNLKVPDVLVSGDHAKIDDFTEYLAVLVSLKKRPELLKNLDPHSTHYKKLENKKKLKAFYQGLSEDEKKSCGLENMETLLNEY